MRETRIGQAFDHLHIIDLHFYLKLNLKAEKNCGFY